MKLSEEIRRYAKLNGYTADRVTAQLCSCGCQHFALTSDDDEGAACIRCKDCGQEIDVESSKSYIKDPIANICNCDEEYMKVSIGVAMYPGTTNTRWVYVGCECSTCNLVGVYVDWQER